MTDYIVGRNPDPSGPHIVISGDGTVSSQHCRLSSLGDGAYKLDDIASTNGTFIREQGGWRRIASAKVRSEDQVRLGKYVTTVGQLIGSAVNAKAKLRLMRNPKTGEIEQR